MTFPGFPEAFQNSMTFPSIPGRPGRLGLVLTLYICKFTTAI